MVVVEFAYEDMKRLADMPRERMVDVLSSLGAPSEYEPEVDKIIAELTPNRPDWYSMEGLARALNAYLGRKQPEYKTKKSEYLVIIDPSVEKVRPHTVCAVVKGLALDDRRIRDMVLLQEKLLATLGRRVKRFGLGLYPLDAIRFPVTYTTMKPDEIRYRPLGHEEEMGAKEILEEHKKGQQYGHLIRDCARYPVFVDSAGKVMALIPIVNSAETGKVDETTSDLFIEVTGTDLHACNAALNILACTFADMGGEVYEVALEKGKKRMHTPDLRPVRMNIDLKEVSGILGVELTEKQVEGHLARMGYGYSKGVVVVPPYRADVLGQIDIIEDIAISYGYNNFSPTIPDFFSAGKRMTEHDGIDRIMRGMGFVEAKTFILTNKEKLGLVGRSEDVVEIANPSNAEYTVVRPTLILDMLETFRINKMKGLPQKFYEIGIVREGGKSSKRLVFGIMDRRVEFADARGFLQTLGFEVGFDFNLEKSESVVFEPEISCSVRSQGKEVGVFGKVSGTLAEKLGIGFDVYVCELII